MERDIFDQLRGGKAPSRSWLASLAQGISSFSDTAFNAFVALPASPLHETARTLVKEVHKLVPPPPEEEEAERLRRQLDPDALDIDDETISALMRCPKVQAHTGVLAAELQVEQDILKDLLAIDFGLQLHEMQARDGQRALAAWQWTAQTRVASAIFAELMDPLVPAADKNGLLIDAAEIILAEEQRVDESLTLREKQATESASLEEAAAITARKATLLRTMRALREGATPPAVELRELARFYEENGGVALFMNAEPGDEGRRTVTR